jgi:hypothetical protein
MKNSDVWGVTPSLVKTDVSEERSAFIIRATRIDELGTSTYLATDARCVLTRATRRNVPEDGVLQY